MNCIYCGGVFDNGSSEHVILSALGGKKQTKSICCEKCNNRLNTEIDNDFAKQLSVIANQINLITGRKKSPATLKNIDTEKGYKIELRPGCQPELARASVDANTHNNGEIHISISARNQEEAKTLLEGQLKKFGKNLNDIKIQKCERVSEHVGTLHFNLSIGGPLHFRSIAKMMLNYFASKFNPDRMTISSFQKAIQFIDKGVPLPENWINFDYINRFPSSTTLSPFNHRLLIGTRSKEKIVYGFLELFGELNFSAILDDQWDGPDKNYVYIVDPATSVQKEEEIVFNISKVMLMKKECSLSEVQNAFNRLFEKIKKKIEKEFSENLIQETIEKHVKGKSEIITPEMINASSQELAQALVKAMCKIDTREEFDILNLFDNEKDKMA